MTLYSDSPRRDLTVGGACDRVGDDSVGVHGGVGVYGGVDVYGRVGIDHYSDHITNQWSQIIPTSLQTHSPRPGREGRCCCHSARPSIGAHVSGYTCVVRRYEQKRTHRSHRHYAIASRIDNKTAKTATSNLQHGSMRGLRQASVHPVRTIAELYVCGLERM